MTMPVMTSSGHAAGSPAWKKRAQARTRVDAEARETTAAAAAAAAAMPFGSGELSRRKGTAPVRAMPFAAL